MQATNAHSFEKEELISLLENIVGKTLEQIDTKGILASVEKHKLQKGIAGAIIEQCVLGYPPDNAQRADLIVKEDGNSIPTELKTTGIKKRGRGNKDFIAKEPMSITAVGVYDIANQTFDKSHFLEKIQHLLIVYYQYLADAPVPPSEYAPFPVKGYEFHQFNNDDMETLKQDWMLVHDLCEKIVSNYPGTRDKTWKKNVRQEYIDKHSKLRKSLSFVELVPRFPPRFRLKKPVVDAIVANYFGTKLETLPGKYTTVSDIDKKCDELKIKYAGSSIEELARLFGVPTRTPDDRENKGIAEQIIVKMFGGKSKKLNRIELFQKFGLIAKTITLTPSGGRTEDMKLFHIDFDEMTKKEYHDEEGTVRSFEFEDSELYEYFAGNEFLCILFEEPSKQYETDPITGCRKEVKHPLAMNKFLGFQRLVFSDEFINSSVRRCWEDTRLKIFNKTLVDVIQRRQDGSEVLLGNGEVSSAPNFIKSSQNPVFIRGGGEDSSAANKTECVNEIKMLPQFIWLKGCAVVEELKLQRK